MNTLLLTLATAALAVAPLAAAVTVTAPASADTGPARVLFVVTSHDKKGDTGQPTGFFLSEFTHPYHVLTQRGFAIDVASPLGGKAPVDGFDLDDPINRALWENPAERARVERTLRLDAVKADDYAAIFIVGGHGTMWDLPDNTALAALIARIYEKGGVVGAVCHGPAALVHVKLSDGRLLVAGHRVAAFTNEEERAVKLDRVVPFLLADKLKAAGAEHVPAADFTRQVIVSGRLVTGQNPASATGVGEEMASLLTSARR